MPTPGSAPSRLKWTAKEETQLCECVKKSGSRGKWHEIAQRLNTGRTGKQCRERWQNCLNPALSKSPWQPEEDLAIFHLRAKLGNKWVEIASRVPGRSDNAVKNRFYSTLRRIARHEGMSAKEAMARFEAGSLDTASIMTAMAIVSAAAKASGLQLCRNYRSLASTAC